MCDVLLTNSSSNVIGHNGKKVINVAGTMQIGYLIEVCPREFQDQLVTVLR